MTVDVRARSFCNLGTIIQANLADEAISARQGLIRCRGQVVLKGISTPTVGSFVYFGWEKDGVISRIPRTLRVLSSFANPFTRQTTVQLGDKLVYLANLRGKKADPEESEPRPDTPNQPDPVEPNPGPAPDAFPPSGFDFDAPNACYIPKDIGANLFASPEAASRITPNEPVLFAPASILGRVPLTIPAQSVLAKCLEALGITRSGESLIAQFTRDSFDLSSGYVNVIDQLLANESLVGYLDEDEVLNIQKFSQQPSAGPLFTSNEIIDLTGINQGILPGQTVTVAYESRRLTGDPPREPDPAPEAPAEPDPEAPPEPEPEPEPGSEEDLLNNFAPEFDFSDSGSSDEADAQRDWEEDITESTSEVEFFLEDGYQVSFSNLEINKTQTIYDENDYVKTRITTQTGIGASYLGGIIQARLQDAYDNRSQLISTFEIPRDIAALANQQVLIITREDFTYKDVKEEVPIPDDFRKFICKDGEFVLEEPTVADDEPPARKEKILVAQKRVTATSNVVIAGQVNLTQFDFTTGLTIPGGNVITEIIDTTYEQNQPSGQTKTIVRRFRIRSKSVAGQQDIAAKAFATTDQSALNKLIKSASSLELEGVDVIITRDRSFGVQKRPSEADRLREEQSRDAPAGSGSGADEVSSTNEAEIEQISPTTEAQPSLPVEMPFGSDDGWVWTASDGFEFRGSNAQALALRYARAQNEILRGNRSGVSLQLPAYVMPLAPLSFVYLEAGSVIGAYRANGMSWAINSDGILCAMDALFYAGVGGSGTPFFPVAPGITTLPAAPTPTAATPAPANAFAAPVGFDPESPGSIWSQLPVSTEPTYSQSIAPTALVPVVNERVSLVGATRNVLEVQERNYALVLPSVAVEYITKSVIHPFVRLAGDSDSYALTGQVAALKLTKRVKAGAGSFTTAGFGAGSIRDYRIGTNAGTFALSGDAALLKYQRLPLVAEASAFGFDGQDAGFFKGSTLVAALGSLTVSGNAAGSIRSYALSADAAAYEADGQAAVLDQAVPIDPYFSNVQLLLRGEGSNGGTSIVDTSTRNRTPATNSGTITSTAQYKLGSASLYFDAASSLSQKGLTYTIETRDRLGTGDYTIELFFRLNTTGRLGYLFCIGTFSGFLLVDSSGNIRWLNTVFTPGTSLAANTWYHLAAVRSSGSVKVFLDGTQIGSTLANTRDHIGSTWYVGRDSDFDNGFYGYIDELRVTKGLARYFSNFTPPTQPYLLGLPQLVGSEIDSNSASDTSATVTVPSHQQGDLLIAVLMWRDDRGVLTVPTGWTLQGTYTDQITFSGLAQELLVYTKTATASEPASYTWSAANSTRNAWLSVAVRDAAIEGVTENYGNSTTATIDTVANRLNLTVFTWVYAASSGTESYSQTSASSISAEITDSPNSLARLSGGFTYSATTITSTHASNNVDNNPNHGGINIRIRRA